MCTPSDPTLLEPGEYQARRLWAERQGRPQWLWPEVAVADWRAALARLETVSRDLLAGGARPRLDAAGAGEAGALGLAAYTSGLGPWLGWQVERGALGTDRPVGAALARHLEQGRMRWVKLDSALRLAVSVVAAAGFSPTVLKGSHTARRYFAEPGLRPMADIDVAVPFSVVRQAEQALAATGFRELASGRLPRPYRSGWQLPGAPTGVRSLHLSHADDGYALDLHGTLDIDFFGVRTVRFGEPAPTRLAPADWLPAGANVLAQPLLAAHCVVHAAHGLHGLTLLRQLELVSMLRADFRQAGDWSTLDDVLRELGAHPFAFPALALVERLAPGTVPPALLHTCEAASPARLRRVVARLTPAGAQRLDRLALDERFMWGSGPLDHLRRMRNLLAPGGRSESLASLARLYRERAYRVLRGRVGWREQA